MIILHAGFSRDIFLWGECSFTRNGLHNLRRMRRAGGDLVLDHIWEPGAKRMLQALESIGWRYDEPVPVRKETLLLPTFAEKYPIPSSPLLGEIPKTHIKRPADYTMRKWFVEALPLDVMDILELLPMLSGEGEVTTDGRLLAHGLMAALDLCYVVECCRCAVSLLERSRFLPDVKRSEGPDGSVHYESIWRPLLVGEDAERFGKLVRMTPPILRASARQQEAFSEERVVCDLFDHIMDGLIRQAWARKFKDASDTDSRSHRRFARALVKKTAMSIDSAQSERRKRGKLVNALNPHALWVRSLGWLGDTDGLSQSLESISQDVRAWWDRFEWFAEAPFKLCLTLQEPVAGMDGWRLGYSIKHLHTGEIVSGADVWTCPDVRPDGVSGEYMRRYFLMLLGQIGANIPPIWESLNGPAPTGCKLSLPEAAEFVGWQAQDLAGKGIAIDLPDWWRENAAGRLTLQGRLLSGSVNARIFDDMSKSERQKQRDEPLSFAWELALDGHILSAPERAAIETGGPLLCVRGQWTYIRPEHLERIRRHKDALPREMPAAEAMRLAVRDPYIDGFADAPELEQVYASLREGRARSMLDVPKSLRGRLRPYQQRGYSWMSFLSGLGLGACLADDMGLGKTVQTLALIQHHRDNGDRRPVLLICPTSVLENWRLEMARFFPRMSSYLHHGRNRARDDDFRRAAKGAAMVLSSYALLHRDASLYAQVDWMGIVLDEAQNIKNPDTQQARAARSIQSGWRLVLTGTPIENHVGDLWSIMEFLMPGMLGSRRRFANDYVKPIQENRDTVLMNELKHLVSPFIMRRMKTDREIVPELPQKIETKVYCGLKREQVKLYSEITNELTREVAEASGIRRKGLVLAGLTRIKQICDHPSLVTKDDDFTADRSAKLERLLSLAEEMFETGDRTLIFTQYVEMGNILKSQLQERFGKEVLFLHGAVFKEARDAMVRQFQEGTGPQFFVLSLKAGGVGLNLTGANHVVMYDRWWNPAVETQAIDRAYRIGQKRNVHVHKFCCRGTLEERIDELVERKKEVASRVIESNDNWLTELSDRELRELLALRPMAADA